MGWLAFIGICLGVLAAIVLLVWAGYRIGRDSRIHEIEDKADDRVYDMKLKHAGTIAALRQQYEHNFKDGCLGELEAYRFRVQREVRDAIQRVLLTVEDAVKSQAESQASESNQ